MDKDSKASARARKQAQREREKALDIKEVRLLLSAAERDRLTALCQERAGLGDPYSPAEYFQLLLRNDWQRLAQQKAELATAPPCPRCGDTLPQGCGGLFKGEPVCWHYPGKKRLEL